MRVRDSVFLGAAASILLATLGSGAYLLHLQRVEARAGSAARNDQACRLFEGLAADAVRRGDTAALRGLCRAFAEDPWVDGIEVVGPGGAYLLSEGKGAGGATPDHDLRRFPVPAAGPSPAEIRIAFRRAEPGTVGWRAGAALAAQAAAVLLVLFLARRALVAGIARQLEEVLSAMRRVDAGDYGTRLDLSGDDPVGQVGRYFNAMVASIEESDRKERDYAHQLEVKTRQLEEEIAAKESTAEALRQSQKMEAVARLAGGVAHDFNNLLTSILGFSSMALHELGEDHPAVPDIEEVVRSGERARDLTHKLLTLGRKQAIEPRPLDLNVVIKGVGQLLKRSIGEDIELVIELDPGMGAVLADPGSMEQVLVNLAVNARDAMPEGGRLYITSAEVELDAAEARRLGGSAVAPGRYASVRVRDTGMGMTEAVRDRVFEPFFTTKSESTGTGLGLSTAYGIIRQCGGVMEVASQPGHGSEFILYLPITGEESATVKVQLLEPPVGGSETILLVEDEDGVRHLTARLLRGLGYHVLVARYGAEGITLAREYRDPIDLVLSDVVMPQLSGPDMVRQISTHREDFKVLYMSGFTEDRRLADSRGRPAPLLRKPFTHDRLARAVRAALDGLAGAP